MKKTVLTLLTISSLLALGLASCQKDAVVTTTFTATLEDCQEEDGKTVLTGTSMQWTTGDKIKVFGTAGSGVYEATVRNGGGTTFTCVEGDAGGAPYRAVYPASAANDDGTIELPVVQVTTDGSLTGFPMYTESNGTNLDFKNLCGILRLRLQKSGVSITAIEVTGDIELTGDFTVAYDSGNPTLTYSGHGTKTTMMTCSTPQSIASQKDFYLFLPVHTYSAGMRIRIYSSDGGVCTKTVTAGHSVRIQRSKITTITLSNNNLTFTPNAGALPGLFTIDDQGHQVRFSQGNLQYTTLGTHAGALGNNMPGTWRFAPEQYVFVGRDIDYSGSKWVDFFCWGSGTNPYEFYFAETFDDWGVNGVVNGMNQLNMWRTLSRDEWNYIFSTHVYASANVNGVNGMIILPDDWTLPSGCTFHAAFEDEWIPNYYTIDQWSLLEAAGAVFLPEAGMYWANFFFDGVNYWTSTPIGTETAYVVIVGGDNYVCTDCSSNCLSDGNTVRLVRDYN